MKERVKRCNICKSFIWRFWFWRVKLHSSPTPVLICAKCHEKGEYFTPDGRTVNTYDGELVFYEHLFQMETNEYLDRDPIRHAAQSPAWSW